MAAAGDTQLPSEIQICREVSAVLRGADDPNLLTFKQVRLEVEASLGLPEDSLRKESKDKIRQAVLSVMDEIDAELSISEDTNTATETEAESSAKTEVAREGEGNVQSSSKRRKTDNAVGARTDKSGVKRTGKAAQGRGAAGEGVKWKKKSESGGVKGSGSRGSGQRNDDDDDNDDDSLVCVLSKARTTRRQVSVKTWRKNIQVDIREYYRHEETGEYRPGFKGITLNPSQWEALKNATEAVDAMLDAKKK